MPDERFENPLKIAPASNDSDSVGAKFQREAELLRDGLSTGAVNRLVQMYENPGETALAVGTCAALGAGLNIASRMGGRWSAAAKLAGGTFAVCTGVDLIRRGAPTIGAMADTWSNPANLQANKDTVAHYAGSALVDYPVMLASGYGGFRAAGKIQGVNINVRFGEFNKEIGFGHKPTVAEPSGRLLDFKVERIDAAAFPNISVVKPTFYPTILPFDLLGSSRPAEKLEMKQGINAGEGRIRGLHEVLKDLNKPAENNPPKEINIPAEIEVRPGLKPAGPIEIKKIELNPIAPQKRDAGERKDPIKLELEKLPPIKNPAGDDRAAFIQDAFRANRVMMDHIQSSSMLELYNLKGK
ncbi:MAG: hypothetical protein K2W95_10530 [Candidatus Obscuribacterales bacterium]|nr:hypothetical protein [Candidatus Obscuribacterales bacterium]